MLTRKRKLWIGAKGECMLYMPKQYPIIHHLKPSEPMLLLTTDFYSGTFIVVAERDYKTNLFLRNKIEKFLAEEVI